MDRFYFPEKVNGSIEFSKQGAHVVEKNVNSNNRLKSRITYMVCVTFRKVTDITLFPKFS